MAISQQLQERIEALAAELRYEVHGPRGCPPWGTKFVDMEQETTEIGDAKRPHKPAQSTRCARRD